VRSRSGEEIGVHPKTRPISPFRGAEKVFAGQERALLIAWSTRRLNRIIIRLQATQFAAPFHHDYYSEAVHRNGKGDLKILAFSPLRNRRLIQHLSRTIDGKG
jgi:hypothetical protein